MEIVGWPRARANHILSVGGAVCSVSWVSSRLFASCTALVSLSKARRACSWASAKSARIRFYLADLVSIGSMGPTRRSCRRGTRSSVELISSSKLISSEIINTVVSLPSWACPKVPLCVMMLYETDCDASSKGAKGLIKNWTVLQLRRGYASITSRSM